MVDLSEIKVMRIVATDEHNEWPAETPHNFSKLVRAYLEELHAQGSDILPTDRSLLFWQQLYAAYVKQEIPGAVILAFSRHTQPVTPIGFAIAGAAPLPYDSTHGFCASGWGTYVEPAYRGRGIATALRAELFDALRDLGFETVLGGVHLGNQSGIDSLKGSGFQPYQIVGAIRL